MSIIRIIDRVRIRINLFVIPIILFQLLIVKLISFFYSQLFGPRWNSEVPRFASNLGFTPLVPQKAAEKSPQNEFPDLPSEICPEVMVPLPESNPVSLHLLELYSVLSKKY